MDLKGFCSFVDIHKTTAWKTYPAHAALDTDFQSQASKQSVQTAPEGLAISRNDCPGM